MTSKRVEIGQRPVTDADQWIRSGDKAVQVASRPADSYSARLTIDVTTELRGRIKVAAFRQGMTVAEMMRGLLEREFPIAGSDA